MRAARASRGEWMEIGFPFQQNFTGIRAIKAKQDFHQRAFPRAVFPKQGMDLGIENIEIDMIVCQHDREKPW